MEETQVNLETGEIARVVTSWSPHVALSVEEEQRGRAALAVAVCKCYGDIVAVTKDGENAHFKYKFASAEAIFTEARKAMFSNGLCILPMLQSYRVEPGDKQAFYTVDWQFLLIEATTGYTAVLPFISEAQDNQDKGINKALTSALKYFLRALFLIPTESADDPDASSEPAQRRAAQNGKPKEEPKPIVDPKKWESAGKRLRALLGEDSAAEFEKRAVDAKVSWAKVSNTVPDDAPASAFFEALEKAIAEKNPAPVVEAPQEPTEPIELAGDALAAAAAEATQP